MNDTTPDSPAPVPAKAGAGASYTTASRVQRIRVPTPPVLGDDDRQLVVRMLDVASDTAARVIIVLTEVDGFALIDAAAVVGVTPMKAHEICVACRQLAGARLAADRRDLFLHTELEKRQTAQAEAQAPATQKKRLYGRPLKHRGAA